MPRTWIAKLAALGSLSAVPLAIAEEEATITAKLRQSMPHLTVSHVAPSPVAGMYRVEVREKGAVFYVTEDASHLIAGDLYALATTGLTNVTETGRESRRRALLASLSLTDQIIFAPRRQPRATVSVFTDVDCPYCRKFHQHIGELNDHGIEVRYLAYPRAGRHSDTYEKMVSAWCADDRRKALAELKRGKVIAAASCANPVADQAELAEAMDVEGTPTIITTNGRKIAGYLPPLELLRELGLSPVVPPIAERQIGG